jgi:hypothetical protein
MLTWLMQHLQRMVEQFQAQVQAQQPVAKVLVQQPASNMTLASGGGFKKGKNGLDLTDAGHQAENSLDKALLTDTAEKLDSPALAEGVDAGTAGALRAAATPHQVRSSGVGAGRPGMMPPPPYSDEIQLQLQLEQLDRIEAQLLLQQKGIGAGGSAGSVNNSNALAGACTGTHSTDWAGQCLPTAASSMPQPQPQPQPQRSLPCPSRGASDTDADDNQQLDLQIRFEQLQHLQVNHST